MPNRRNKAPGRQVFLTKFSTWENSDFEPICRRRRIPRQFKFRKITWIKRYMNRMAVTARINSLKKNNCLVPIQGKQSPCLSVSSLKNLIYLLTNGMTICGHFSSALGSSKDFQAKNWYSCWRLYIYLIFNDVLSLHSSPYPGYTLHTICDKSALYNVLINYVESILLVHFDTLIQTDAKCWVRRSFDKVRCYHCYDAMLFSSR